MTSADTGWRALVAAALLLLTAAIWGFAFVAQRQGMDHVGPFLFNALRFSLGCLPLIPFVMWSRTRARPDARAGSVGDERHGDAIAGAAGAAGPAAVSDLGTTGAGASPRQRGVVPTGIVLGLFLFGGASLQQAGLQFTTVAKSGFITGLYVVFVPFLGLFLGLRLGPRAWGGTLLATVGLYLLTFGGAGPGDATEAGGGTVAVGRAEANAGDLLMLACALFWACHILAIDRWANRLPWPQLAVTQFLTCAVLSLAAALLFEPIAWAGIAAAGGPILYAGLLSVGVGYTLQVVAQRDAPAAPAAVIMSLEAVFAAIGGWWLLSEALAPAAAAGCALMLAGMVLSALGRPAAD
jgi:drug/metabolite transporter (DMT)-like permease